MTTVAWQTWIEINPHAAERLGVQDDDVVRGVSAAGEVEAIVYVYPGIREDVVAMPIGQRHDQYGRYAQGHGSNPMGLLAAADGETGALTWATTQVLILPTGRRRSLVRLEDPEGIAHLSGEGHQGRLMVKGVVRSDVRWACSRGGLDGRMSI